ncbi:hypothetical protein [Micromonospora sp. AMSO31t]|uniref:hypothetical protein n=1 Tax=Micromonospora sp. AMSO31t TaxID=2650566 RepID=UPI001CED7FD1|nr:hypothetical protein [Micromonospora sp. AMSO31t]
MPPVFPPSAAARVSAAGRGTRAAMTTDVTIVVATRNRRDQLLALLPGTPPR